MTRTQFKQHSTKADSGEIKDEMNPIFILTGINTDLLTKVLTGEIDLKELAKRELENRGLNAAGQWVGFNKEIA